MFVPHIHKMTGAITSSGSN